jgi:shikimate kinase
VTPSDTPPSTSHDPTASSSSVTPLLRLSQTVVLTGYMGAGKSTIGRKAAKALGVMFFDTDRDVVHRANLSIASVFEQFGEPIFRQWEREALLARLDGPPCILATGGGTLTRQDNLDAALQTGRVVYLEAPPSYLYERVIFSPKERPMLDVPDPEAAFRERFEAREPFYLQSHKTLHTMGRKPSQVVEELLTWLYTNPPPPPLPENIA